MIELLRASGPISTEDLAAHIGRLRREAARANEAESLSDLPTPNEVPSVLRALERECLARLVNGEWEAVPIVAPPVKRDLQKGLF